MKKYLQSIVFSMICLLLLFSVSYGQTFSMERDFPKSTVLPKAIYKMLLKSDESIRRIADEVERDGKSAKKTLFQAARITLNNDKLPDLIVKGQSRLLGANVTEFWIFQKSQKGYILVLRIPTHSLSILKNKSNKFRNIRIDKLSAVQLFTEYYRFDGKKYVYSWGKVSDI